MLCYAMLLLCYAVLCYAMQYYAILSEIIEIMKVMEIMVIIEIIAIMEIIEIMEASATKTNSKSPCLVRKRRAPNQYDGRVTSTEPIRIGIQNVEQHAASKQNVSYQTKCHAK